MKSRLCVIISGGGTGGHIFPALAIGEWITVRWPEVYVHYVGAQGGMEMQKIPENGFSISGLWVSGFQRGLSWRALKRNLSLPFKIITACWQAFQILRTNSPKLVIGVGGYASLPTVFIAQLLGIPTILAEQNAFPGLANRLLAKRAQAIWLGNEFATRFFVPQNKAVYYVGNPVRTGMASISHEEACASFALNPEKPTVFIFGGSLGAGTFNKTLLTQYLILLNNGIQIIWQTGGTNYEAIIKEVTPQKGLVILPFIKNMAAAYSAATLVVARAGAMTLTELITLQQPAILVPSPNVTDDHQTHNAKSITEKGAGWLITDSNAPEKLIPTILKIFTEPEQITKAKEQLKLIKLPDTQQIILKQIEPYLFSKTK